MRGGESTGRAVPRGLIVAAFAAIYLIWGSTYLAIRFAVETLPPFIMAGSRFVVAGGIIYAWARLRGAPRPTREEWRAATIVGAALILVGNGTVSWAEQYVASGLAVLLIASEPSWIVMLNWARPGGTKPTLPLVIGIALGFMGVGVLIGSENVLGGESVHLWAAVAVLVASVVWAAGSLYSRYATQPHAPLLWAGMQLLAGGVLQLITGSLLGEWSRLDIGGVSLRSWLSLIYLIVFGAIVAYTAYIWLLRVVSPARVSTYAYVNPVLAVSLGWWLGNEPMNRSMIVAAVVIVAGVVMITTYGGAEADMPAD